MPLRPRHLQLSIQLHPPPLLYPHPNMSCVGTVRFSSGRWSANTTNSAPRITITSNSRDIIRRATIWSPTHPPIIKDVDPASLQLATALLAQALPLAEPGVVLKPYRRPLPDHLFREIHDLTISPATINEANPRRSPIATWRAFKRHCGSDKST